MKISIEFISSFMLDQLNASLDHGCWWFHFHVPPTHDLKILLKKKKKKKHGHVDHKWV